MRWPGEPWTAPGWDNGNAQDEQLSLVAAIPAIFQKHQNGAEDLMVLEHFAMHVDYVCNLTKRKLISRLCPLINSSIFDRLRQINKEKGCSSRSRSRNRWDYKCWRKRIAFKFIHIVIMIYVSFCICCFFCTDLYQHFFLFFTLSPIITRLYSSAERSKLFEYASLWRNCCLLSWTVSFVLSHPPAFPVPFGTLLYLPCCTWANWSALISRRARTPPSFG